MFSIRRWLFVAVITSSICAMFLTPWQASATTGPSDYLPNSKYKVAPMVQQLYTGQYIFTTAAKGARLSGAAMGVEVSSNGYLYGVAQFYGYDSKGAQSVWTATLYNFHGSNKQMSFQILGPTGTPVLGQFSLTRSSKGDLSGQIQLSYGKFAISLHKISSK